MPDRKWMPLALLALLAVAGLLAARRLAVNSAPPSAAGEAAPEAAALSGRGHALREAWLRRRARSALESDMPVRVTGSAATNASPSAADGALPPDAIPGEYVLSFFSEADRDAFARLAKSRGAQVLGQMRLGNSLRLRVGSQAELDALLRDGPRPVDQARNFRMRVPAPVTGTDPRAPQSGYVGFGRAALDWLGVDPDNGSWGEGVRVAVLDSGIAAHVTLDEDRITRVVMTADPALAEAGLHGTAVASLIAGNADTFRGTAPSAELVNFQVVDATGYADMFTVAAAIVDAADRGCRVINMSMGSHGTNYLLERAVAYAGEQGSVIVAASGNDGWEGIQYPAAYDSVVAVGAVDAAGRQVYFSNRGATLDLTAPGVAVSAAGADGTLQYFSGTSAAAPFVSGAIAALLSADPDMTAREAADILIANCDDRGAPGRDNEYGAGVLNMARVEDRDTPGIYDVAMGDAWLRSGSADPVVALYVQNRGTEPLRSVEVQVEIDGVRSVASFSNLAVGQTASRDYTLSTRNLNRYGQVKVSCTASIDNQDDANPRNNTTSATLKLLEK